MRLSYSVVLWQGRGGIPKIAIFGKWPSPYYGKNSSNNKNKWQSIITLRHEGQSVRTISRTFKVSSSAVAKTIKRYEETGSHEDRHRKGRRRVTSAAEDKFIRVTSLRLQPKYILHRVQVTDISTSTVQRRLRESGLHAGAKKHEQWTLDRCNSVLWSDESKFDAE